MFWLNQTDHACLKNSILTICTALPRLPKVKLNEMALYSFDQQVLPVLKSLLGLLKYPGTNMPVGP